MKRERVNVGGILFDNLNLEEVLKRMEERIKETSSSVAGESKLLLVANQDILNHVGRYRNLTLERLNRSFLIIPDGYSIIYGAKYLGTPLKERVCGPDVMERFIKISSEKGYRNFFLGAAEGVAEKMAEKFRERYAGMIVAGIYSPPFGEFTEEENQKITEMVNSCAVDVLWVSFGCPKQEWWILNHMERLSVPIVAGVGAAFDFHSGNKKRAPKLIQELRLEWFYRMMQEPKRLWKRYLKGGIRFIRLLGLQKKSLKEEKGDE